MNRWLRAARQALALSWALAAGWAVAQVCAVPQNNGANVTSTANQVVNGYFTPANGTYSAGSQPTTTLSGARGSTTWAAGDMALVIQMQCVDMNRNDADTYGDGVAGKPASGYLETSGTCRVGQYEYVPAGAGSSATSFVAGAALQNTYVQANPTASTPRRSFQVIRVPQYGNFTLGGTLSGMAWNGTNGGAIVLDVAKTLNFNGQTIDMAGDGFRGGGGRPSTVDGNNPYRSRDTAGPTHASKGEGIAGTPRYIFNDTAPLSRTDVSGAVVDGTGTAYVGYPGTGTTADFDFARGAPGNAGGGGQYFDNNYHNGGGGGGGNGGSGGRGGFGYRGTGWGGVLSDYSNIEAVTGQHLAAFGGSVFGGAGVGRVVLGGGGGAGDQNGNSTSTSYMSGAPGGGIVMIRAGALSGSGTIDVRGGSANSNTLNDSAGGAGAGGSAVVISPNWTAGVLSINGAGGQGGDAWLVGGQAHSGGGGGGGGVVVRSGAATVDVSGGGNGITNTGDSPPGGADHGALPGNNGFNQLISEASDPVSNSGYKCLPLTDLAISKVASTSTLSIGQTTNFTLTIGNSGPSQATAATVLDAFPAGLTNMAVVSATGSNAATTLTASTLTGGSTFTGTVTIPANQTLTVVLRAVATSNGSKINSASVAAPANAVDTSLGDNAATATVVVGPSANLSAAKAASTPTLVIGGTTTFTLTFVNPGPSAVTGARITDTLPSGLGTLTFVSASVSNSSTLTSRTVAGGVFTGTATLPVNSTLTVVLRATAGANGAQVNTVLIAPPTGTTDTDLSNNTATATVNVGPQANLGVTKSASPAVILEGQTTLFAVTIVNAGPNAVTGATLNDTLPSGLTGITLTAVATAGSATVTARAASSSALNTTMTMPVNSTLTYTVQAIAGNVGQQVNVVTVSPPAGTIDPVPSNNTAQATVTVPVSTNLSISKTNSVSSIVSGSATVYGITVSNNGPYAADGAIVRDAAATGLSCTTLSCAAAGGAVCPVTVTVGLLQGTGLELTVFPASSSLTFLLGCGVTATGL